MKKYHFRIEHYEDDVHTGTDYIGNVTEEEYRKCLAVLFDFDDSDAWEEIYQKYMEFRKEKT
ncbi:MAG: hypothetical protein KBS66_07505 [Eubacterium sp.]|nr:hypothetical protein [Candidatus Colimonas fimequi]